MNWREVGTRALLTFIQAFLAVLLVDGLNDIDSWDAVQPAIIAAVAALLSMLYRVVREYQASKGWED
jgi:uncharacterized membrane protein YgaE (UPF0421/DUF939 family)